MSETTPADVMDELDGIVDPEIWLDESDDEWLDLTAEDTDEDGCVVTWRVYEAGFGLRMSIAHGCVTVESDVTNNLAETARRLLAAVDAWSRLEVPNAE